MLIDDPAERATVEEDTVFAVWGAVWCCVVEPADTLPSLLRLGVTLLFRWSLPFGFATSSSATSKWSEEGSCPGKHCQRYTTRRRMQPTPFEAVYHTPAMLAGLLEAQVCEHAGHHVSSLLGEYRDVQRVHVPPLVQGSESWQELFHVHVFQVPTLASLGGLGDPLPPDTGMVLARSSPTERHLPRYL